MSDAGMTCHFHSLLVCANVLAGFFKGTSADQDRRFSDKELKLLKTMKFPPEFDKKVRMSHIYLDGAPNVHF